MGRAAPIDQGGAHSDAVNHVGSTPDAMKRQALAASLCLTALASGCGATPPAELAGLWSAGPAACAAGVGVRFEPGAIDAVYQDHHETLFERPRYQERRDGGAFEVRIVYQLPRRPGGAYSATARGVITLAEGEDGFLRPIAHNLLDGRTGSARVRIGEDPALAALTLAPCGPHSWRGGLRGRSEG
jgi:hypothetical protein